MLVVWVVGWVGVGGRGVLTSLKHIHTFELPANRFFINLDFEKRKR